MQFATQQRLPYREALHRSLRGPAPRHSSIRGAAVAMPQPNPTPSTMVASARVAVGSVPSKVVRLTRAAAGSRPDSSRPVMAPQGPKQAQTQTLVGSPGSAFRTGRFLHAVETVGACIMMGALLVLALFA